MTYDTTPEYMSRSAIEYELARIAHCEKRRVAFWADKARAMELRRELARREFAEQNESPERKRLRSLMHRTEGSGDG